MGLKVLKFGGTSVGSIESLKNVKRIVENNTDNVIVVVSALGGVTDKLIEIAQMAVTGQINYEQQLEHLKTRHYDVINGVVPQNLRERATCITEELTEELSNIYRGVFLIKDLSDKTLNAIVSYGERLSSNIIAHVIVGVQLYDARKIIKTEKQHNKHTVDFELSNKLIKETFAILPPIALVAGFISTDRESNEITNLGRGGSDYTAAIIAAALQASQLEIWTDVDGFMTADPRIISNAYVIEHLSFKEAMELCNFGAKVIYPPTIYPVYNKNIPIRIKNTFNATAPGTLISDDSKTIKSKPIKGISSINDTCLITVSGLGMIGVIGVNYRIFKALAKSGVSVFLVSQASSENTTSFAVRNSDADLAVEVLLREFKAEIEIGEIDTIEAEKELATVAIVGENMKHTPGIAGKLFNTLGRTGINVIACAQGASETNISFVINLENLRKALNVIHDSFFLADYQVLNVFVTGVGLVGKNLLKQIEKQQPQLMANNSLKINVVGIANSKKTIFMREGIALNNYAQQLSESQCEATPQSICNEIINMNIFNAVFVDCTASSEIAGIYKQLLSHNISVVTANKIAASSHYDKYKELKEIARSRGVKFLFETNVGAGLPIINTINSLINSGDKIIKIEAVVSGTLNYIFNVLSHEVPMSKAIIMAKEAGYSEPDPRLDLNGHDVLRKLVILARESGYRLEQEDVEKNLFIPASFFKGSLDNFLTDIASLDAQFEAKRQELENNGLRQRFVAKLENGKASIGLQEIDNKHPFYHLEGSNNIILLTTERYNDYPMEIKGYGAGASVTAAGVFADIISIANIR